MHRKAREKVVRQVREPETDEKPEVDPQTRPFGILAFDGRDEPSPRSFFGDAD